jgi:hypothetical protein
MDYGILHIHNTVMKDEGGMWKNMAGLKIKTVGMKIQYVITPTPGPLQ